MIDENHVIIIFLGALILGLICGQLYGYDQGYKFSPGLYQLQELTDQVNYSNMIIGDLNAQLEMDKLNSPYIYTNQTFNNTNISFNTTGRIFIENTHFNYSMIRLLSNTTTMSYCSFIISDDFSGDAGTFYWYSDQMSWIRGSNHKSKTSCDAIFWYWQTKFCTGYHDEEDEYWLSRSWGYEVQNYINELFDGGNDVYG